MVRRSVLPDGRSYFTEALNEIEDMLEIYAERWEPLYLKGTCLAMQGKPDQAIPLLNQAIAAEPSAEAYLNLATAHQSHGNLGLAYAGQGDRDRAIASFDKAIELDPEYQPAIDNRRIFLVAPDERLAVQSMREIDFYGDRARAGSQRPASVRALAR